MSLRHLMTLLIGGLGMMCNLISSPQSTDFSQRVKPATLKVLLHKEVPQVLLEVKGRHHIYNPLNGVEMTWGVVSRKFPLKSTEYGLHWGEQFPGTFHLRFVPGDSQSSVLVNGIQYRGCVEVSLNDNLFTVVNEVDIESYLKSTLSSEFTAPLPDEVLNSVAIVARTSAYFLAKEYPESPWHVVASECGYQGTSMLAKPYIDKAVSATYHAILTYDDKPFATCWTKDSAGQTVDFAAIFRKSLQTPPGIFSPIAKNHRIESKWTLTCSKAQLEEATRFAKISTIDLYIVPDSSKVYGIKVSNGHQEKDFDFITFQKLIGPELKSNDFALDVREDSCTFTGYGEGPGVGLCLYTAKILAEKGEKAPQILHTFYPDTRLEKVKSL
ncbi:SpoIID/LytB domain-containing protein [Rhabdochlamydiaceae symbiont of Dictyostelium giganteum]|uniref:SpoIID/LytB domain-containing protein n=1 Tax=Rhabdochlamydiaceae symbiont of Dictyostelium giganteum TaxID=3342349 RepID=UPI00384DF7B2